MKNSLFFPILLSIVAGIFFGTFFPKQILAISWIGQLFINLLKMIVLPLIFSALFSAITSLGAAKKIGTIGVYTLTYVLLSASIAVTIGLVLLNVFKPGVGIAANLILANAKPADITPMAFSSYMLTLFPPNLVAAAARYEIMPIVFFSIVFAMATLSVGSTARPLIDFFTALRDTLIRMVTWLMYLTPVGLFSLLGTAVAEAELQHKLMASLAGILIFIVIFLCGLLLQIAWQMALVAYVAGISLREFINTASNAMLTAFATSSSMATLPVTLIAAKEQQIDDEISRFVLPLATTINLAGTAMYEAVSALFFCQILGFHLSIFAQIGVFITAIIAGIGATGIPEGGLITMIMVLRSVNVPVSAIGILLPFDRILDRFRTMTNVFGDLCCAVIVNEAQKKAHRQDMYY